MHVTGAIEFLPEPLPVDSIDTPAVLIRRSVLERNIKRVAEAAASHAVLLRPHSKTHKSAWIAQLQIEAGAVGCTTAKVSEAERLVHAGIPDVFVAYPVSTPHKIERLLDLAERAHVATLVEDVPGAQKLSTHASARGLVIEVWADVDTGLDRVGSSYGEPLESLVAAVQRLPGVELAGLSTHEGHVYAVPSPDERGVKVEEWIGGLVDAAASLGLERVSIGATPTILQALAISGVTDARPGNYVFYDAMQVALGSAGLEDCALSVIVSCVSHRGPDKALVDAGSKALSLDIGAHGTDLMNGFGVVKGRPDLTLHALSEEHGWVRLSRDAQPLEVGQRLELVPNHACATIANFDNAYVVDDDDTVTALVPVTTRGCFT